MIKMTRYSLRQEAYLVSHEYSPQVVRWCLSEPKFLKRDLVLIVIG